MEVNTECYRVYIPHGVKVTGTTASGVATAVLPGEYMVHRLRSKCGLIDPDLIRFVGSDGAGRDVHVRVASLRRLAPACKLPQELLAEVDAAMA